MNGTTGLWGAVSGDDRFPHRRCLTVSLPEREEAWYRSIYAPRTGGAYDSHHRTAGIAGCTWRRGDRVAIRGGRAAGRARAAHRGADEQRGG